MGARIEPGDILIGKITPKGESDPSPEEKLLRAIFGDKAGDVKDASLKASPSLKGVVIGKRLFSRVVKTRSSKLADKALLPKIDDEFDAKIGDLKKVLINKLLKLTENYTSEGVKDYMGADINFQRRQILCFRLQRFGLHRCSVEQLERRMNIPTD